MKREQKRGGRPLKGDYEILARLRLKEQEALEMAIHQYAGYVAAVIHKTLGALGTPQDAMEPCRRYLRICF